MTTNMSKPTTSKTNMSKPSSTVSAPKQTTTTKTGSYTPSTSSTATYGTSSAANKALQTSLNSKGANLAVDGKYGPATAAAFAKYGSSGGSLGGGSPTNKIIKNQSNLVQTTDTEKSKQNTAAAGIDSKLQEATGVYGTPVKDAAGNIIGTEKFNTKTGEALVNPNAKPEVTPEGNVKDSLGNTYFSSMPKDMTYKLPNPSVEGNKWVFDAQGKPYEMDATGKVTTNTMAEQEYNTNIQSNKLIDDNNAMYDSLKKNVSAAHQNLIDGIKQKAQLQRTQMEDLNKRYLASKTVAGFRTGSTEYTPEIAMGILKAEQEEGIQRIQEIDDKMNLALAEAVTAKNSDELDIAKQKFDDYKDLQKQKEDAIIEQYKTYADNQKYINDAKKALATEERATKDQAIQDLKVAADAYVKGYNSAKDKKAYVNNLAEKLGLDPDMVLGQIINATPKPEKGTKLSESDKISNVSSMFDSSNTFTNKNGDEVPIIDQNGYANPDGFKYLMKTSGVSRTSFIKEFGHLIYLDNYQAYGLTPVEVKLLSGKLPSSGNTDEDIL